MTGTNSATSSPNAARLEEIKVDLLRRAQILEQNKGFSKTSTNISDFSKDVNGATDEAKLKSLAESIDAAYKATPTAQNQVAQNQKDIASKEKLRELQKSTLSPLTTLTDAEKVVIQKSPYAKDIEALTKYIANMKIN